MVLAIGWTNSSETHIAALEKNSGQTSVDKKSYYWKKIHGEPYASSEKVWMWSREPKKTQKPFDPRKRPFVVTARMSEVSYKVSKVSNSNQVNFLHFDILKHYV